MEEPVFHRLKHARKALGLTQDQVSEATKISRSSISKIESGTMEIPTELLMFYTGTNNISSDWLLTGRFPVFNLADGRISEFDRMLNQRIVTVFELFGYAKKANGETLFAQEMGLDKFEFGKIIRNETTIPPYALLKVLSKHHLSIGWLLTGMGTVNDLPQNAMPEATRNTEPRQSRGGGIPLVVTVDSNRDLENIEMVETRAAAGYIQHHLEPEYIKDLPKIYLPGPEFRNATFRAFQVQGESMAPGLQPEDYVIGSYVHNWPTNIQEGYVYVVVTQHTVLVKRLLNRIEARGKVVLLSDNEAYSTQEIDKEDIIELWRGKARISFKFPNMRYDTHKKIANLESDVFELQQVVKRLLPKNNTTD